MPNKDSPDSDNRPPEADPSDQAAPEPSGNRQALRSPLISVTDENENRDKLERDIRRGEKWLIVIGAASVLVNILIALVYYDQLKQMRLATDATTQALRLAQESAITDDSHFDRTMHQVVGQTAAQQQSAQAAINAVKVTRDTVYAQQRPWVALYIQEQDLQPGSNTVVNQEGIVTRNTGRTPAVHVRLTCFTQTTTDSQNDTPDCESLKKKGLEWRRDVLEKRYRGAFPGISDSKLQRMVNQQEKLDALFTQKTESSTGKEWMIPPNSTQPLGEGFIQAFNSKATDSLMQSNFVYMVGILTHQDLLRTGETHTTKFCLVKWRSIAAQFCRRGQWMD